MVTALVPVKALRDSKGRLAALLSPDERRSLALSMLEDVLRALQAVPAIDQVAVVSPDSVALDRARALGAEILAEPPLCRGVNQALSHAVPELSLSDGDALLVAVADIPAASPADVEAVVDALPQRGVAVVPTEDRGTGLLALRPPNAIPFRFGRQSSVAHKREAVARGLPARVLHRASLFHDIDEPRDLARFISQPAETATHSLLAALGIAERLEAGSAT